MKKKSVLIAAALMLATAAGAAAAVALKTITLQPGRCTTLGKTKICAAQVAERTVTLPAVTNTVTLTVMPSPIGKTFTGNGDETLAPLTLSHGVEAQWTSQPDSFGFNDFSVSSQVSDTNFVTFDNGNSGTSGQTYIPPGTYTLEITASGVWSISF